ncbi:MAG: hypothetical protein V1875_06545 [Candidatus Altiarchaeota archaeon]
MGISKDPQALRDPQQEQLQHRMEMGYNTAAAFLGQPGFQGQNFTGKFLALSIEQARDGLSDAYTFSDYLSGGKGEPYLPDFSDVKGLKNLTPDKAKILRLYTRLLTKEAETNPGEADRLCRLAAGINERLDQPGVVPSINDRIVGVGAIDPMPTLRVAGSEATESKIVETELGKVASPEVIERRNLKLELIQRAEGIDVVGGKGANYDEMVDRLSPAITRLGNEGGEKRIRGYITEWGLKDFKGDGKVDPGSLIDEIVNDAHLRLKGKSVEVNWPEAEAAYPGAPDAEAKVSSEDQIRRRNLKLEMIWRAANPGTYSYGGEREASYDEAVDGLRPAIDRLGRDKGEQRIRDYLRQRGQIDHLRPEGNRALIEEIVQDVSKRIGGESVEVTWPKRLEEYTPRERYVYELARLDKEFPREDKRTWSEVFKPLTASNPDDGRLKKVNDLIVTGLTKLEGANRALSNARLGEYGEDSLIASVWANDGLSKDKESFANQLENFAGGVET